MGTTAPTRQLGPSHLDATRQYEVQRAFNFEVSIPGLAKNDVLRLSVEGAPSIAENNEEILLSYGNRNAKVAGKATFDSGTLTLKDFVEADTELIVREWRKKVYEPKTDRIGMAADYKKDAWLTQFGPDGSHVRTWVLKGCWPQAVNYGTFSYTETDKKLIEITLAYDRAYREDE